MDLVGLGVDCVNGGIARSMPVVEDSVYCELDRFRTEKEISFNSVLCVCHFLTASVRVQLISNLKKYKYSGVGASLVGDN